MSLLLLGLAIGALAAVAANRRGSGSRAPGRRPAVAAAGALAALAYGLPALFVLACWLQVRPEGPRYRFALVALGFRGEEDGRLEVRLGGDPGRDEITVANLSRRRGEAPTLGTISVVTARGGEESSKPQSEPERRVELRTDPRGAAGVLGKDGFELLDRIELAEGDRLRVGSQRWRVELEKMEFVAEGGGPIAAGRRIAIPSRSLGLPFAGRVVSLPAHWFGVPPGRATYAVNWLAAGGNAERAAARYASFLYQQPQGSIRALASWLHLGARGARAARLFLAKLDPAVRVERGSAEVQPVRATEVGAGERVHVYALPDWSGDGFAAGGLAERQSFRLEAGRRSVAVLLENPETVTLSKDQLTALGLRAEAGDDPHRLRVAVTLGESSVPEGGVHFRQASKRLAGEGVAVVDFAADGAGFRVNAPRGVRSGELGRPFWIGADRLAAVQIDRIEAPLALAALGLVLAMARAVAARAMRLAVEQVLLGGALDGLLALRLVLAFGVWAQPPHRQVAMDLALVAWSLLPWAYLAASAPRFRSEERYPWWRLAPAVAGCAFSLLWCVRIGRDWKHAGVWAACHVLAMLAGLYGAGWPLRRRRRWKGPDPRGESGPRESWPAEGRGWQGGRSWLEAFLQWRLGRRAVSGHGPREELHPGAGGAEPGGLGRTKRLAFRAWEGLRRPQRWGRLRAASGNAVRVGWAWLRQPWRGSAFLFAAGRLALLVVGKESATLGGLRFSFTLLHVPLAVIYEAAYLVWLWRQLAADPAARGVSRLVSIPLGVWLVPAFLVSDLGLALVNIPVFLVAAASVERAARRLAERRWSPAASRRRSAPAGALVLLVAACAAPAIGRMALSGLQGHLPASWMTERNYLRVLHFVYPEQLEELAVRPSEDLATMSVVMKAYTAGPAAVAGHGYLRSEVSPQLRATALREHVPAVLIAGQWGLLGTLGILAILVTVAAVSTAMAPWAGRKDTQDAGGLPGRLEIQAAAGAIAGLTLGLVSVYMLLANYDLLPFTGRNVYLLGLDSHADVLESLELVVLMALGGTAWATGEPAP